jgi:pimeloyl-ACP methyl ester carboxylesterase
MATGYKLPIQPELKCGRQAEGFFTPAEDTLPQIMSVPPARVIPIIFLPGIMGSNLRLKPDRQAELQKKNNIAWRPDSKGASLALINASTATRQRQLDPGQTEVDIYDPASNPTGDAKETADARHDNAEVDFSYRLNVSIDTPLLMDDPSTKAVRKTKEQKARERGWGEVFFSSYRTVLEMCEQRLNSAFFNGNLDPWWKGVVGVDPKEWQASAQTPMKPLAEAELKQAIKGCWFPVHAMGYNWLESNKTSGEKTAKRITALIEQYKAWGYQCEKVIIVTHSMGGLVARAVIHPKMGNLDGKVLGIVHGVMPAIGAGAAYKRMRCGFEGGSWHDAVAPMVLGNEGDEVTAVLGNSPGGLQLLPSTAYGNGWLHIKQGDEFIKSLPQKGDPYEEIYKLQDKWYSLIRQEWLNPAGLATSSIQDTLRHLNKAREFHQSIEKTYHDCSYAHYGCDADRAAWHHVVWGIDKKAVIPNVEVLAIAGDDKQGELTVRSDGAMTRVGRAVTPNVTISLQNAVDPGDQTVPMHSADHQLHSGKFKGIFRQTGYEHQGSYKNDAALNSTIYSLVRIAKNMTWST